MAEHTKQCDEVESDPKNSVEYGINFRSALLSLKYLDICTSLIPDVMHDVLEGVVQYELKLFIQYCIESRYFRRHTLQSIMEGFEFGYMESTSHPTPITAKTLKSNDSLLKQNGMLY